MTGVPHYGRSIAITSNLILNQNGSTKSGQKSPGDPGVALYITRWNSIYCFPCDQYLDPAGNIGAIAAHLDALRGQERWGVGTARQSFEGYLLAPTSPGVVTQWWDVLGVNRDAGWDEIQSAYRRLAMAWHPDKANESDRWDSIARAYEQAKGEKNKIL